MNKQPMFPVRLPAPELREYRKRAIDEGLPLVEVVRRLLALWFAGKVKVKKAK